MGKIVQIAKLGYGAYSAGKTVVGAVSKPAHFLRKSALKAAKAALLASIAMAFGDRWAQKVLSSMKLEGKTAKGAVNLKIPDWLARWAMDEEGAALLGKVANDAISAPFAVIGYGIARVEISYSELSKNLRLGIELGAMELGVVDVKAVEIKEQLLLSKPQKPRKPKKSPATSEPQTSLPPENLLAKPRKSSPKP